MTKNSQSEMNWNEVEICEANISLGYSINLKNKLYTDEIAMSVNSSQTENDYLAIPYDH